MAQYTPKKMMASTPAKPAAKKSTTKSTTESAIPNIKLDKNENLSVRQIENGFIVSESGTKGKGRNQTWFNKEYFSQTNPIKFSGKK
ncbi:MAG TPA: hypothetical protein PLX17_02310 [Chitinophagaceae bacterium]|nr:hypothetical protein [Chitinophagaceae bacterium]